MILGTYSIKIELTYTLQHSQPFYYTASSPISDKPLASRHNSIPHTPHSSLKTRHLSARCFDLIHHLPIASSRCSRLPLIEIIGLHPFAQIISQDKAKAFQFTTIETKRYYLQSYRIFLLETLKRSH